MLLSSSQDWRSYIFLHILDNWDKKPHLLRSNSASKDTAARKHECGMNLSLHRSDYCPPVMQKIIEDFEIRSEILLRRGNSQRASSVAPSNNILGSQNY